MRKISLLSFLMLLFGLCTAQSAHPDCSVSKRRGAARVTVADAAEDNYDIKHVKFNLSLTNLSTTISGDVTTTAQTVVPSFSSYVFELDTLLTIDSVLINGVSRPFASAGVVRTVSLAAPLPAGTTFAAQVFYHGTPMSGVLYNSLGMNSVADPTSGHLVTYTMSQPYRAREWWPCKQSLRDKIDSTDMWVIVPDSLKVGSNGMLKAITTVDATHKRYEWKETYPIDYYLVSIAASVYTDTSFYMHFTSSTDSMLLQNYIFDDSATLAMSRAGIDSLESIINYFSSLYGRYPFWHEKYGHCLAPCGGGMEHQTMTTLLQLDPTLILHEMGHQWFGDNVTCGTWADIIMNEGFANYTVYLYEDHYLGHATATYDMTYMQGQVKTVDTGTCYVDDTTIDARIFDGRLSYYKGCCLLHMLRFIVDNDSAYFSIYRTYQQNFGGSTGTISDFRSTAEGLLGTTVNAVDLDTFFNQWAYEQGYPLYQPSWNQVGTDVYVQINQSGAVPASVAYFTLPLEIRLHSATGDTIVRVVMNSPSQLFHFSWANSVISINLDPNHWLIFKTSGAIHDNHLGVPGVQPAEVIIAPNPASESWQLAGLPLNSELALTDISGRVLWSKVTSATNENVPAKGLATGLYILTIRTENKEQRAYKLVKE